MAEPALPKRFLGEGSFLRKKGPSGAPAAKGGEGYNRASQSAELPCPPNDLEKQILWRAFQLCSSGTSFYSKVSLGRNDMPSGFALSFSSKKTFLP